ncbi:MAG: hypothetical protein Fues2KO_46140 [Fuerstiella sp.]
MLGLILLLVVVGPLFVCMPVNSDVALFDVQADQVLRGGVLYRDIVEPNLPGVVWIHLAVRSVVGWSSQAMRVVDLLLFGSMIWCFTRLISDGAARLAFAFSASLFYLSCNEWCHCQRDTWMLLPTALAISIRYHRLTRQESSSAGRSHGYSALLEGICWGAAFWIKPHVALPAMFVIGGCVLRMTQRRSIDAAWVVGGGLLAAVPGIAWLVVSDTWPHFWDMMLNWNPEYLEAGRSRQSLDRWLMMFRRFHPWWMVHLVGLPLACGVVKKSFRVQQPLTDARTLPQLLIAAVYLGWLLQSLMLQHAMDYIHVPAIVLALLLLSQHEWRLNAQVRRPVTVAFLLLALLASPLLKLERLAEWPACFSEGSTDRMRSILAHGNFPAWQQLHDVGDFLKRADVQTRQLTCQNVHSVHLFRELQVQPATRYWSVGILQELFPKRAAAIEQAVKNSDTRFIVTEARESQVDVGPLPDRFPWNLPVVYQSGTYRVHRMPVKIVENREPEAFR